MAVGRAIKLMALDRISPNIVRDAD